jgi:hypothetical protein
MYNKYEMRKGKEKTTNHKTSVACHLRLENGDTNILADQLLLVVIGEMTV